MSGVKTKISILVLVICTGMFIGSLPALGKTNQDEIMMKIRRHIEHNMLHPTENVRMEFISRMPALEHLSGKITYRIESRSGEEYVGDTSFKIRIFADGIFIREESVRVRIEVLREFVVSLKSIARNSVLSEEDVTVQKKWVKRIPMNAISSLDDALGKTIVISARPNAQITRNMLREVTPVKKGKMVQVILDNGIMKMQMRGVAEEDGAEDALVRVRNLTSNKIIYARVIGQSKVQIDF